MTAQENGTFWYKWLLKRGSRLGRFDCISTSYLEVVICESLLCIIFFSI